MLVKSACLDPGNAISRQVRLTLAGHSHLHFEQSYDVALLTECFAVPGVLGSLFSMAKLTFSSSQFHLEVLQWEHKKMIPIRFTSRMFV